MIVTAHLLLLLVVVSSNTQANRTSEEENDDGRPLGTLYGRLCPRDCASCSPVNGCVTCRGRTFLHVQRTRTRETGVCVASCPAGHVGVRRPRRHNHCTRCRVPDCDVCLTPHYCTRCSGKLFELHGRCVAACPGGLAPTARRECLPKVDCVVSAWSTWGVCARHGRTCGAAIGVQTRLRHVVQLPSSSGRQCPDSTEDRKCRIAQPSCPAIVRHRMWKRKRKQQPRKGRRRHHRRRGNNNRWRNKLSNNSNVTSTTTDVSNQINQQLPTFF